MPYKLESRDGGRFLFAFATNGMRLQVVCFSPPRYASTPNDAQRIRCRAEPDTKKTRSHFARQLFTNNPSSDEVVFGTLAVLGLIGHHVHAYTTVPSGARRAANILAFVAVAMLGTIDSLAQCLLFMKGATVRFFGTAFGTAKACAGREVLMLDIGQVSGQTPITNTSIDTQPKVL